RLGFRGRRRRTADGVVPRLCRRHCGARRLGARRRRCDDRSRVACIVAARRRTPARTARPGLGRRLRRRRLDFGRYEERERTALARRALDANLAAEQARDLAADRQAEAGAAVLAAGRAVGLLERLEDELLLVARNADAGVAHLERHDALGAIERAAGELARRLRRMNRERDAALRRELEGVGEQVL